MKDFEHGKTTVPGMLITVIHCWEVRSPPKAESSVVCRSAKGTAGLPFADSTPHLFCSPGGTSRAFYSQADHRGFAEAVEITVLNRGGGEFRSPSAQRADGIKISSSGIEFRSERTFSAQTYQPAERAPSGLRSELIFSAQRNQLS